MSIHTAQWGSSQQGMPETIKWLAAPALAVALAGPISTSTTAINWEALDSISQTEVLWGESRSSFNVAGFTAVREFLNCYKQISLDAIQQIYDLVSRAFPEASISFEAYKEVGSLSGLRFVVDLKQAADSNLYEREVALFSKIENLPSGHAVLRNSIIDIY